MSQYFKFHDTEIAVGDTVKIYEEIQEGEKKRNQIFEGIVIALKNSQNNKTLVVRKLSTNNIGVEKIFPLAMPAIKQILVVKKGQVRRAKLYYLRNKIGKDAYKIKEKKLIIKTKTAT